jgi:hypothetical protein
MSSKYYVTRKPQHYAIQHLDEQSGATVIDLELRRVRSRGSLLMNLGEDHMQQIANFLNEQEDKREK